MRKPIKKILALFLAFSLAGVSGGFSPQQIFAQTPEQKQPSVAEKTTTSITFTTENDLEYAIQTEKPDTDEETKETSQETDKAKDMVWTWAKEEQYNRENNTVVFRELKAGTTYTFTYRQKNSTTEEELPVFQFSTAEENEKVSDDAGKKPAENPPQEEPSVPIDTKPQENHSPTVDTNSQNVDSSPEDEKSPSTDSAPADVKPQNTDSTPAEEKPLKDASTPEVKTSQDQ